MRKALLTVLSSLLVGCGGGGLPAGEHPGHGERSTAPNVAVSEDGFASAVRDLLASEPGSPERGARLAGIEARQMSRASARFKAHSVDGGLAAVTGGLYLLHTRELKPTMLSSSWRDALVPAARELAARGDEGRARAVYEILLRVSADAEKREIQRHLDALASWTKDTAASAGPVQSAGALETMAVARRLLEPSEVALEDANSRTRQWVEKALELLVKARAERTRPPREEGLEVGRALQSGGTTLAAIYLRDGDARGALKAVDPLRSQSSELVRHDLVQALEAAVDKPKDAQRWLDLLHALRPAQGDGAPGEEENMDDRELIRAAAFGVAMEAYRLDPSLPEAAGAVAAGLQEYGMAEASPAILLQAARAHDDPRTISGVLAIAIHAMGLEVEAQDASAARRAYAAALPLLALADAPALAGKLQPSSAQVRAMMGEIELREGRIAQASVLLNQASQTEKSGAVLSTLARIERYEGRIPAAVAHLKESLLAPDVAKDAPLRAEILLTLSDIARQGGDAAAARASLADALKDLARARSGPPADSDERARLERVLAKVLDRFGAEKPAQKALERAFDAAPRDKGQASATLGIMVGRALLRGDLLSGRDGLKRAVAADLEEEDLIYLALWVRFIEKQVHATTDGGSERVFASIVDDGRWIGRLAAFGGGRIKADELVSSAKTPAQKTEALFYAALDRRASGDARGAESTLKQVLTAGGVDLMEVALTRDMLDGPRIHVTGPMPEVGLP